MPMARRQTAQVHIDEMVQQRNGHGVVVGALSDRGQEQKDAVASVLYTAGAGTHHPTTLDRCSTDVCMYKHGVYILYVHIHP
jgi:GH24 family phage-related lysozyme (muramidase)